jgi:hypothetical protein
MVALPSRPRRTRKRARTCRKAAQTGRRCRSPSQPAGGDGLIVADNGRFRPTAVSQALVEQVRAAEHDTLAELLSDWPPEQRDELVDMLNRLVNDLLGHPSDGREVSRAQPQPTAT